MVETLRITFETAGPGDIIDVTEFVRVALRDGGLSRGIITVFVTGSTGGLTTIEYEPGLLRDLAEFFDRIIPANHVYHHDETWHDSNGFSHIRASLVGPDLTVPFVNRELTLGRWQQIVFLEFDNRPRHRTLILQMIGE